MEIRVLGCSGGVGGQARTTSFLVNDNILIDAGTGVMDLEPDALARIDHVFLTHSHLDHVVSLPLVVDTVGPLRNKPITVHAQKITWETLKKNIFNWDIWPDFTEIPDANNAFLKFAEMSAGETRSVDDVSVRSIAVNHTVPAVGFLISNGQGSLAFSGDTTVTDEFWEVLNECESLKQLVMETTFTNQDLELSNLSKHFCPSLMVEEIKKLKTNPEIFITHLMPGQEKQIMAELKASISSHSFSQLRQGQVFKL